MIQRSDISADARRNMDWIYDSFYPNLTTTIERDRRLDPGFYEGTVLAQGEISPREMRAFRLVDRLAYWDQVETSLLRVSGVKELKKPSKEAGPRPRTIDGAAYAKIAREKAGIKAKKKIAVVHAIGLIGGERSGTTIPFGATMGAGTMEEAFRQAAVDEDIEAIIFRIDSGGGGLDFWRSAAPRSARDKPPLVVSMSDRRLRAYLTLSQLDRGRQTERRRIDRIDLGRFNMKGLYDKIGVTKDFVTCGRTAWLGQLLVTRRSRASYGAPPDGLHGVGRGYRTLSSHDAGRSRQRRQRACLDGEQALGAV
jgi:hypothetical protein